MAGDSNQALSSRHVRLVTTDRHALMHGQPLLNSESDAVVAPCALRHDVVKLRGLHAAHPVGCPCQHMVLTGACRLPREPPERPRELAVPGYSIRASCHVRPSSVLTSTRLTPRSPPSAIPRISTGIPAGTGRPAIRGVDPGANMYGEVRPPSLLLVKPLHGIA